MAGTTYKSNSRFPFSGASQIGNGNYVIMADTAHSLTVTGLPSSHIYYFESFDYNDSGIIGAENYDTTSPAIGFSFTSGIIATPTKQSVISFFNVTATSISVKLSGGNGQKRLLLVNTSNAVNDSPVNGMAYTANTAAPFTGASELGTGNYVILTDTSHMVTISTLTANQRYYFACFDYNDNGKTDSEMYDMQKPGVGDTITEVMTGIKTGDNELYVFIYPNPVSAAAYIALPDGLTGNVSLTLAGADGKTLYSQNINSLQSKNIMLDMSAYPSGIYIVSVQNSSGKWIGKLIKD